MKLLKIQTKMDKLPILLVLFHIIVINSSEGTMIEKTTNEEIKKEAQNILNEQIKTEVR